MSASIQLGQPRCRPAESVDIKNSRDFSSFVQTQITGGTLPGDITCHNAPPPKEGGATLPSLRFQLHTLAEAFLGRPLLTRKFPTFCTKPQVLTWFLPEDRTHRKLPRGHLTWKIVCSSDLLIGRAWVQPRSQGLSPGDGKKRDPGNKVGTGMEKMNG